MLSRLSSMCAVLGLALPVFAQNCNGAPPSATLATLNPFAASFYGGQSAPVPPGYTGMCELFDMTLTSAVTITGLTKTTYDQGVGNPVVPNQVGNTTTVNVWICPTTWTGNQFTLTSAPGTPWILAGSGTLTVTAWPAPSPVVLTTPISLSAGSYGVALETTPTTVGANPGPLHVIYSTAAPLVVASDTFMTLSNQAVQGNGFIGGVAPGNINATITYTPTANAALVTQFGSGCYFRPQAFYEGFPAVAGTLDLANTGISMIPQGPNNYLVVPTASTIVPTASANLTLGTPGSSSSGGNWDDSLSTPITLPFNFPFPSGSTSSITVGSNGFVYLAAVTNSTFNFCGAAYGSTAGFKNNPPRIAGLYADLDMSLASNPLGGIYVDVDPSPTPQFVRITWDHAIDFSVATAVSTFQMTLFASGQVDISYGPLALGGLDSDAIIGFSTGNGANLPPAQDLSATMPFSSGDGSIPPILTMSAPVAGGAPRPVLGTTPRITTTNITPGTFFVFLAMGFTGFPAPGIPLAALGMPGCQQYVSPLTTTLSPVIGGVANAPLTIPNVPAYQGFQVFAQSAPLTAGLNAAGILTSNAICLKIGQ